MAITNNSKLISAINKQTNSSDPGCGCGAVLVRKGDTLPAGDYVMMMSTSAALITLNNIVWKGVPWLDTGVIGTPPATSIAFDFRYSMRYEMNIESCDVAGGDAVFYRRCK